MDKTLMKGLRVLECVARSRTPKGASEVAAELGMTKSNAYRTLQTLVAAKYITRMADQTTYEPTSRLFELGTLVGNRYEVKPFALPILRACVEKTGENAAVSVLDDREVVYVERVDSPNPLRSVVRTGERLPAYCSASGKCLLAFAPDSAVEAMEGLLRRFTEHTVTTLDQLRADLRVIREKGVAVVKGEWHPQVSGVAVPVWNHAGRMVASLSISGPTERMKPAQLKRCIEVAQWGAQEFRARMS